MGGFTFLLNGFLGQLSQFVPALSVKLFQGGEFCVFLGLERKLSIPGGKVSRVDRRADPREPNADVKTLYGAPKAGYRNSYDVCVGVAAGESR